MDRPWTPGPWVVSPFAAIVESGAASKLGGLLPIAAMLWPTDERSEVETFANARLIAAAPDLFEALAVCRDYFANLSAMTVDDAQEAMAAVCAALTRALPPSSSMTGDNA